jgi:hypothetical protein
MAEKAPKTAVFSGGIPIDPDVEKLKERFGIPQEGVTIRWSEIEAVIDTPYRSHRFNSVVSKWRKKLRFESNVIMKAINGIGLQAADPESRVVLTNRKGKSAVKMIVDAEDIARTTDSTRLSEDSRKINDHFIRSCSRLQLAVADSRKLFRKLNE